MCSSSFLDRASLLAQTSPSARLGRRACGCAPTATARRAPLNDSSVQGSPQQASASVSAPTQVDFIYAVAESGLPSPRGHRLAAAGRQGLHVAATELGAPLLVPSLHHQRGGAPDVDGRDDARSAPRRLPAQPPGGAPATPKRHVDPGAGNIDVEELPLPATPPQGLQQELQWGPVRAAVLGHRDGDAAASSEQQQPNQQHREQPKLRPQQKGQKSQQQQRQQEQRKPPPQQGQQRRQQQRQQQQQQQPRQLQEQQEPHKHSQHQQQQQHPQQHHVNVAPSNGPRGPPAPPSPPPPPPPPPRGPVDLLVLDDPGPSDPLEGLMGELASCGSFASLRRFLQLHRPHIGYRLMGAAVVHLSHLVDDEPPSGAFEQQVVAGMLDDLTLRLRGGVGVLRRSELAALVCALSKLRSYDGPLLREAAAAAREQAAQLSPRQVAGLLWAYARYLRDFHLAPEPGWALALLEQGLLPRLPAARPAEVAMTLYGLALLRAAPPPPALAALLGASLASLPGCGGPELAMSMTALATMQHDPGPAWLAGFLARCEVATRSFARGSAVAAVLHGLAVLGHRPSPGWMQHFMWQAQRRFSTMDEPSLVQLAWALARMRYRPEKGWTTAFLRVAQARILMAPRAAATLLGTSSQQQAQQPPEPEALRRAAASAARFHREQQRRLQLRAGTGGGGAAANAAGAAKLGAGAAGGDERPGPGPLVRPQTYNLLLWALVRLSVRPSDSWLLHLSDAVQPRLGGFPPREQAMLLWALARLSWRPHEEWMIDYLVCLRAALPRYQPLDCVIALLGLSRLCGSLGYTSHDSEALDALAARLEPSLGRLSTTTLVSVLLAQARLEPGLPPGRLAATLAATLARVRASGGAGWGASSDGDGGGGGSESGNSTGGGDGEGVAGNGGAAHAAPPPSSMAPGAAVAARGAAGAAVAASTGSPAGAVAGAAKAGAGPVGGAVPPLPPSAPHSTLPALPPLSARQCANAVFAVGCAARRAGRYGGVRALCAQLLRELLPRASALMGESNGLDMLQVLQGIAAARLRCSPEWLWRHEAKAAERCAAGVVLPLQVAQLHRAYRALGHEPRQLPALTAEMVAAAAQQNSAVRGGRRGTGAPGAAGDKAVPQEEGD